MSTFKKLLLSLALLSGSLPLTACALSGGPLEGQVLEAETKKPLPGAIVVARWKGSHSVIAETKDECYHVETATTDADGRYRIPAWSRGTKGPLFTPGPWYMHVHKAGYEEYWPAGFTDTDKKNVRYLKPFTGGREERLAYLSRIAVSCSDRKEIEINLLPLYKALYEEAEGLVVTKDDKLKVLYRLRDVERLELGTDKAWENFRQRERELK